LRFTHQREATLWDSSRTARDWTPTAPREYRWSRCTAKQSGSDVAVGPSRPL